MVVPVAVGALPAAAARRASAGRAHRAVRPRGRGAGRDGVVTAAAEHELAASVAALWDRVTGQVGGRAAAGGPVRTARGDGLLLTVQLAGREGISDARRPAAGGQAELPGADAAGWLGVLVRAGDPRPVRRRARGHPRLEPLVLPGRRRSRLPGRAQPGGRPRSSPTPACCRPHGWPRPVYDSARPGSLGRGRVHRVPGGDARRGHPAPEHAACSTSTAGSRSGSRACCPADGVLLAERTEGIASVAHAMAYCQAIETIAGTAGAVAGSADPGAARRARTARMPPGCHRPAGRRGRAGSGDRPVRLAQGTGAAANRPADRAAGSAAASSCPAGSSAGQQAAPGDVLAAVGDAGPADRRAISGC